MAASRAYRRTAFEPMSTPSEKMVGSATKSCRTRQSQQRRQSGSQEEAVRKSVPSLGRPPLPPPPSRVPPARAGAHLHSIVREWVCLALLAEHIEGAVEAGDNEELVYFEALRRLHRRRLRRLRLRRRRRFGTLGQRPLLVLVLVLALVLVLVLALLVLISWRPIGPRAELRAQFLRGQ